MVTNTTSFKNRQDSVENKQQLPYSSPKTITFATSSIQGGSAPNTLESFGGHQSLMGS